MVIRFSFFDQMGKLCDIQEYEQETLAKTFAIAAGTFAWYVENVHADCKMTAERGQ